MTDRREFLQLAGALAGASLLPALTQTVLAETNGKRHLVVSLVPEPSGIYLLATYAKHSPSIADRPSMAAFDACLTNNNLQPQQSYPSQFDASVAAQQEFKACGSKIPPAVIKAQEQKQLAAQSAMRDCVRGMGGFGSRGFGRFHRGSRGNIRGAYAACQSLLGRGGAAGPAPPKSPAKAVAPIA